MTRKKVLLVDDSPMTLVMEQMVLRNQPYEIVTARNGPEAIELAVLEKPDVIVLDVDMPGMNGFETCRRMRQEPSLQAVPIILVANRGEEQTMQTGFESGCTDYITKPISGTELLTKVRACLLP